MIRGLAEKGGVMGMNYCPSFLRDPEKWGSPKEVSIDDIIRHIRHIVNVGGIDCVGLAPISTERMFPLRWKTAETC